MSIETSDDEFSKPMIFFRVGWMERYRGMNSGDKLKAAVPL